MSKYKYEPSYDLVNQYDWTSVAPGSEMRNEAPAAYISAYELQFSQLRSFIDGYLNILSPTHFGNINKKGTKSATPGLDFYKRLYGTSTDPITRLSFPFFSDNIRSFSTEFADTFSPVSQRGAKMLGGEFLEGLGGAGESVVGGAAALASGIVNIGAASENAGDKSLIDKVSKAGIRGANSLFNKAFGTNVDFGNPGMQTIGAPGTYIETPKFYQYSNTDNGLELSFALSNTLHDYAKDQNYKFIKDFTRMNRPFRTGSIGMTFPAIYNIVVPGQRYIMWAYLEDFNVGLLGMRRRIRLPNGGSRIVPEAYSCQFSFRSLTIEAANFIDEMDKFGSFGDEGDENSYIALKKAEEASLEGTRQRQDTAARERSERNKIDIQRREGISDILAQNISDKEKENQIAVYNANNYLNDIPDEQKRDLARQLGIEPDMALPGFGAQMSQLALELGRRRFPNKTDEELINLIKGGLKLSRGSDSNEWKREALNKTWKPGNQSSEDDALE